MSAVAAQGASLNAGRRDRELDQLVADRRVDVLVIGLGATGAGVALDAASRGLSVVAVDAHDLAYGTSRWSSKLIHGGLRYLAHLEFGVAYESAVERGVLMTRTAPHLVRPLPMLLPLTPAVPAGSAAVNGLGLRVGDLLRRAAGTPARVLPAARRVSAAESRLLVPALREPGLRGGLLSWDGQLVDDARLVVALARTAARHGARILTRVRAEAASGHEVVLRDTLGANRFTVRARAVINATGVWAGEIAPDVPLRPSRGSHLVLPGEVLGGGTALTVPLPGRLARFVFALPQPSGLVYVGLTDEPLDGPVPDVPEVPEHDVGFLLDVLGSVLRNPPERRDVLGAYAGLRPLLADGADSTADVSRRHAVIVSRDGLVTVVGGKLTTYRRMARDALDEAIRRHGLPAGRCLTRRLPLVGAGTRERLAALRAPRWLVARYGVEAPAVLREANGDPELLEPIADDVRVCAAELRFAVRHEGALDEADLLDRRTRIGLVPEHREVALSAAAAALTVAAAEG